MSAGGRIGAGLAAIAVGIAVFLLLRGEPPRAVSPPAVPAVPSPPAPSGGNPSPAPESGDRIPDEAAGGSQEESARPGLRALRGRVVGPDGRGLEAFAVGVSGREDGKVVLTRFDGTFEMEVAGGTEPVSLQASREGWWVVRSPDPATAFPASGLEFTAVRDFRGFRARGRVVDRRTGEEVPWTEVTVEIRRGPGVPSASSYSEMRDPAGDGEEPEAREEHPGRFLVGESAAPRMAGHGDGFPDPLAAEFRVLVVAPGYRKTSTPWERFAEGRFDREIVIEMEPVAPAILTGRVTTASGAPYEGGLRLTLEDEDDFLPDVHGAADAEGRFRIGRLPPGSYRAHLAPDPDLGEDEHSLGIFAGAVAPVVLPDGGTASCDFVLPATGDVTLRVVEPGGAPVEDWQVELKWRRGRMGAGRLRRIRHLLPGDYDLTVTAEGHEPGTARVLVRAGETVPVEVRMERAKAPAAGGEKE